MKDKLNVVAKIISGGTPKTKIDEYWDGNIGWLSIVDFGSVNKYVYSSEKTITEKGLHESSTNILDIDDIIISARGTVGSLAKIGKPMAFNQSCFGIRANKEIVDSDYLYYFLKNHISNIRKKTQGSVFETINLNTFDQIEVTFPSLKEQKKIANMLANIDKKIDNNNYVNDNLYQILQTIYDYWFTQFDFPDENGKPYRSSGGKMVWNKGINMSIPDGWEVCNISDLLTVKLGGTPSTNNPEYWDGDIPWLSSGEVNAYPIISSEKYITKEGMKNSSTSFTTKGSILVSITGYINVGYLNIDACFNQSVVAVEPNDSIKVSYLYPFLKSKVDYYMMIRTGAVQPHINKEVVETTKILLPSRNVLDSYYKITEPIHNQIVNNGEEASKLTELRDWLLPMLMNGQATIKE